MDKVLAAAAIWMLLLCLYGRSRRHLQPRDRAQLWQCTLQAITSAVLLKQPAMHASPDCNDRSVLATIRSSSNVSMPYAAWQLGSGLAKG